MNRRAFLKGFFRMGALAGLLALAGFTLWKSRGQEDCETFNACRNCSSLKGCEKPQAINYRNDEEGS